MPQEDKISSIIDQTAINAEIKALDASLDGLAAKLKNFPTLSLGEQSKSMADLTKNNAAYQQSLQGVQQATTQLVTAEQNLVKSQQQLSQATVQGTKSLQDNIEVRRRVQNSLNSYLASQKEDLVLMKAGTISRAEYNKRFAESQISVEKYKNQIKELNNNIKNQTLTVTQQGGSYAILNKEYLVAQKLAKDLAAAYGTQDTRSIKAAASAAILDARLKEIDKTVGQSQRNVGNYGSAFNKAFSGVRTLANILPGIGLAGLFGLAIDPIVSFTKYIFGASAATEKLAKTQQSLGEIFAAAGKEAGSQVTQLTLLREIITDQSASLKDRNAAVVAYNSIADEGNQIDAKQIDNNTLINSLIERQIALVEKRALAKAFENKLTESAGKVVEAQIKINNATIEDQQSIAQLEAAVYRARAKNATNYFQLLGQLTVQRNAVNQTFPEFAKELKDAQSEFDALLSAGRQFISLDTLGKKGKDKKEKTGNDSSPKDLRNDTARQILEAQKAIDEEILKREADTNKRILDNETRTYKDRLAALNGYVFNRLQLNQLEKTYNEAIEEEKLAETLRNIDQERKAKGANLKLINEIELGERKASAKRIEAIEQKALTDLQSINRLKIEETKKLKAEREKVLSDELQQEQDYEAFSLKQLDGFYKAVAKADEDEAKRKKDLNKKGNEDLVKLQKDLYKELISTLSQFFLDGITRQEQDLEEKSRLLDEETARRINQINQLGLSEVERTKQIAAVEKDAQFQREQIEKRQRKLAVERAKFEKAANIAQIIASTAAAIIETLKTYKGLPIGFAIAATIGAIGALQLAKAISTPLPKYKKGRGATGVTEVGILNDGSDQEFKVSKGGAIEAIQGKNTPTLIGGTDIVYPNFEALAKAMGGQHNLGAMIKGKVEKAGRLEDQNDTIIWNLRQLNKKPVPETHVHGMDNVWFNQHFKY